MSEDVCSYLNASSTDTSLVIALHCPESALLSQLLGESPPLAARCLLAYEAIELLLSTHALLSHLVPPTLPPLLPRCTSQLGGGWEEAAGRWQLCAMSYA
jgi:hypothetical protein